jgi:hypothetical protein
MYHGESAEASGFFSTEPDGQQLSLVFEGGLLVNFHAFGLVVSELKSFSQSSRIGEVP